MADNPDLNGGANQTTVATHELKILVDRIEDLEDQKAELSEDVKDLYTEAASKGFDKKALRKLIALRRKKPDEAREEQAMVSLYANALGMDIFS